MGEKIKSIEEKGSVKIGNFDNDNSDIYSDSSVATDTDKQDESLDSLRSIGILSMHVKIM